MPALKTPLPPLDPLRRYSVEYALAYLGISRRTFYEDIAQGRIATIKDRKRRFVPGSEIVRRSQAPV
jgi:excisionase family DNA binding protein